MARHDLRGGVMDAPEPTFQASLYELRTHGLPELGKPNCRRRLADLSSKQLRELIAALIRLRPRHSAINDDLFIALDELMENKK
jgi:hypothetical protein